MVFLAPSPQYGLDDYLYIYEIYKQKNGNRYSLNVRYFPANTYFSGTKASTNRHTKLLRNAKSLRFQYYGLNKRTGELAWYDSWLNQDTLPIKVSISAELSNKRYNWPKLIAETKYGAYILP